MKTLQEILKGHKVSNYQNSPRTREMVADQIKEIYGEKELQNYSPDHSALPFSKWKILGYRPKKGSKALKSITLIETKDDQGNIIKSHYKKINLFYYRAVEPITD